MSSNLVIVESPAKARTIGRILGKDYVIDASYGHVRDLPEKGGLAIDVKNGFNPSYTLTEQGKKTIGRLAKLAKDADHVWLATDPDREGEAISWHLYEVLSAKAKKAEFHRVTFHEITKSAVQHSFEDPASIDMDRVNAQQARRILDRIVGYKLSPLLARNVRDARSAGRVQSVAVRLVCDREKEINAFEPVEYWLLTANFDVGNGVILEAKLHKVDGKKAEVGNAEQAEALAQTAQAAKYKVAAVTKTPKKRNPSPPFITSTLQQAASSHLRFTPDRTMRIAQQLYEGVDGSGDGGGLITYMRTDSFNVSKEAQQAARDLVTATFGADYVPAKPNRYRSRGGAQEAHEAIRPTDVTLTPDRAKAFLDHDQLRLYTLVYNRFLASQMTPAKQVLHAIEIEGVADQPPKLLFRASATTTTFPGFLKAYSLGADAGDDSEEKAAPKLPDLKEQSPCGLKGLDREQKFTEPPPRFSEATLVRELEANGVGRPSTYAQTIRTIQNREYVKKEKSRLAPTPLGMSANDWLVKHLPELLDVKFTARMESQLDNIEDGKLQWQKMLEDFYKKFGVWLKEAITGESLPPENVTILLDLFGDNVDWAPPRKSGRTTYDDQKFVSDLRERSAEGELLTNKQTKALFRLILNYSKQLGNVEEALQKAGAVEPFSEIKQAQEARAASGAAPDSPEVTSLLGALAKVTQWDEPTTRGRRTYDDKKFYESLRDQAEGGRNLSANQVGALRKLVARYRARIPGFEEIARTAGVEVEEVNPATVALIKRLLPLGNDVQEWNEPTKGRGGRVYDDKEFFESVSNQFDKKGTLSDRQIGALKRMLAKYKDQIPDFASRTEGIDFSPPQRRRRAAKKK